MVCFDTCEVSCVYSYEVVICVYILVRRSVCSLVRYSDHALVAPPMLKKRRGDVGIGVRMGGGGEQGARASPFLPK